MEVYRCHPCDTNFQSKASLSDHLDNKHLNDNNECFLCSRKISCRANLSRHLKEIHFGLAPPKNIKCPQCPQLFNEVRHVYYHFNSTHKNVEGTGACPLCASKDADIRDAETFKTCLQRKHFYDNHCQIVRDSAEREELEKTRQAKKQELEKMIQRKRDEKQAKKEESDWIRQENGDRIRVRRRIIETTAPKKKIIPKNMDKKAPGTVVKRAKSHRRLVSKRSGINWQAFVLRGKWRPVAGRVRNPAVCSVCGFEGTGGKIANAMLKLHVRQYHPMFKDNWEQMIKDNEMKIEEEESMAEEMEEIDNVLEKGKESEDDTGATRLTKTGKDKEGGLIKCAECVYKTSNKGHIKIHMIEHHGKGNPWNTWSCDHCNFRTTTRGRLLNHKKEIHNDQFETSGTESKDVDADEGVEMKDVDMKDYNAFRTVCSPLRKEFHFNPASKSSTLRKVRKALKIVSENTLPESKIEGSAEGASPYFPPKNKLRHFRKSTRSTKADEENELPPHRNISQSDVEQPLQRCRQEVSRQMHPVPGGLAVTTNRHPFLGNMQSVVVNVKPTAGNIQPVPGNIPSVAVNLQQNQWNMESVAGNMVSVAGRSVPGNMPPVAVNVQKFRGTLQQVLGNMQSVPISMLPVPVIMQQNPLKMQQVPGTMLPVPRTMSLVPLNMQQIQGSMQQAPENVWPVPESTQPLPGNDQALSNQSLTVMHDFSMDATQNTLPTLEGVERNLTPLIENTSQVSRSTKGAVTVANRGGSMPMLPPLNFTLPTGTTLAPRQPTAANLATPAANFHNEFKPATVTFMPKIPPGKVIHLISGINPHVAQNTPKIPEKMGQVGAATIGVNQGWYGNELLSLGGRNGGENAGGNVPPIVENMPAPTEYMPHPQEVASTEEGGSG